MDIESLISTIIDCAVEVKRTLGLGFLEAVYRNALLYELSLRGVSAATEVCLKVIYKNKEVGFYRADIVVDNRVIVELKVSETLSPAHDYQLVNYLRATGIDTGLLLNFGTSPLGIHRKFRNPQ